MALNTFNEVVNYLDSFSYSDKSKAPGIIRENRLERMENLLKWIKNPEKDLKIIHLAGSKGKGSTATYLAILLKNKGYKTGLYLSPHVSDYRERFTLAGRFFDDDFLIETANLLKNLLIGFTNPAEYGSPLPSTFEIYTAYAYLLFKESGCTHAVIETGIGGRLDATNTTNSIASVILPIELEHTSILGDTIEKIAYEKSKIIKEHQVVFSASQAKEALNVIKTEAVNNNSKFYYFDDEIINFHSETLIKGEHLKFQLKAGSSFDLQLSVFGRKQAENIALAILIASKLNFLTACGINELQRIIIKGRFMPLKINNVPVVIDVAHTKNSILSTASTFYSIYKNDVTVIFGALEGKDVTHMLETLISNFDNLIISQPGTFKKSNIEDIYSSALKLTKEKNILLIKDNKDALDTALKLNKPILITGSFYLAGPMLDIMEEHYGIKC